MPPKAKKADPKKTEPTEDESGIPKNDILFKFSFQVKQNEVADILLMLEWVSATNTSQREKLDSELIESWTPANPADPTLVNYELEIPASYRIDDKFIKNFCKDKFYIHFVSTEDQTIKDTIYLHYSPLLTAKGEQPKFESYHDKIKIPQIESFQVTLSADKELLTPMYKDFLNPLEICIVGAKEMPANNTSLNKYEPVYVQAQFFDGTVIKTQELPHNPTCKWMYKQVIPVGFMDHIKLMEALRTMPLLFQVHDQDELAKNNIKDFKQLIDVKYEEPAPPVEVVDPKAKGKPGAKKAEEPKKDDKAKDAKGKDAKGKKDVKKKKDTKTFEPIKPVDDREFIRTNYGVSNFNLNDLLNPHLNNLKLRNYIVPIAKYENKDSTNLDLNTTARREVQGAHIACDYISNDSYLVVTFEIAHAIRLFKKPPPPAVPEVPVAETQAKGKAKPAATKPITPAQKGRLPSAQEKKPEVPAPIVEEKPVFERAVYIFPYKSPIHTPKLLSIIQRINMEAFGQADGNPLYITTKALTDDEKRSRELDIITGLEFIDHEYRTFILEGLSDKAMKRLEEEFPKNQPNSKALKILKNPDVKFKERVYADCNIDIKKIRLRENLAKLLIRPEIYLRSKVPEHIYNILISFCELRRCENIKAVVASNLFPPLDDILAMERKYGDALTDEDISGIEGLPQKLVTRTVGKLASMSSEMATSGGLTQAVTTARGMQSKSVAFTKDNSMTMEKVESAVINTKVKPHLMTVIDDPKANKYNLHMNKAYPVKDGQEVHTRANTKLNIYEQQKAELREIVRNDPNHFYTYSVNYLSQSIDPYSPDDIKREEDEHKKTMWKTPNGFQTILKKDKKDYMEHPKKPHQSKIDELGTYPWHQDKLEETKKLANSRGDPIRNGVDFKLRIGGIDTFSAPEIVAEEKITAVEKERRIREAKRLSEEEWKNKVIVENTYFYTSTCTNKSGQLDKIKGIREGDAKKKGLILKDNRLKQTTLGTTKTLAENPISMYLEHAWEETSNKNLFEREVDLKKTTSAYDFRRNIKEAHQYDHIYKPMKETFPQIVK